MIQIPLPGIYLKQLKLGSQRDINTLIFTEALFTIVKMWKQPKYIQWNENENITCQNIQNTGKSVPREKCIALNAYIKERKYLKLIIKVPSSKNRKITAKYFFKKAERIKIRREIN